MTDVVSLDDYFNSLNPSKILIGALTELKQIEIPISFFSDVPDSQMAVTVNPTTTIVSSSYNRIITVDPFDSNSIVVNVTAK